MKQFEIDILKAVFARCFGLDSFTAKANDKLSEKTAIDTLAYQSGMRRNFIESNFAEIQKLAAENEKKQ